MLDINAYSCPNCGTAKGAGDAFCPQCGTPKALDSSVCAGCGFDFAAPVGSGFDHTIPTDSSFNKAAMKELSPNPQGFDIKALAREYADNFMAVIKMPDKMKLGLRYGSYAAAVLIFLLMWFPVAVSSIPVFGYIVNGYHNMFWVSAFGAMMFLFAFLCSAATFLPWVQSFMKKNLKLEPFVYLIVPLLELLGMLSMFIGLGIQRTAVIVLYGTYASVSMGFVGWLILLLCLAGIGASVFSFIKYDLAFLKSNNPFKTVVAPHQSVSDAFNTDSYQNTVYYGNDAEKK